MELKRMWSSMRCFRVFVVLRLVCMAVGGLAGPARTLRERGRGVADHDVELPREQERRVHERRLLHLRAGSRPSRSHGRRWSSVRWVQSHPKAPAVRATSWTPGSADAAPWGREPRRGRPLRV